MRHHTAVIQMRFVQACLTNVLLIAFKQLRRQLSSNIDDVCLCVLNKMTNFNYDLFKDSKMTNFNYDLFKDSKLTNFNYELFKISKMTNSIYELFKVSRLDSSNTLHISPEKGIQNNQFSVVSFPTKKMSLKKGIQKWRNFFTLGLT